MLSETALKNLQRVWKVAENDYKLEVHGHLRENDIPVIIKMGDRSEVLPDCDVAYKYITFHTHPQIPFDYDDRLTYGKMVPTIISGPDIAQLFSCNTEPPVKRTELVLGEFGVVEASTTPESVKFYTDLSDENRALFLDIVRTGSQLYGNLFQFNYFSSKRLIYQLENIDVEMVLKIAADKEEMEFLFKENMETLWKPLYEYLDAYDAFSNKSQLPTYPYKIIDLKYYWFDPSIRDPAQSD